MESNSVKCSYFDASALIKLVSEEASEEPGRSAVRKYVKREANLYTTAHCISEALGVLKVKCFYRKSINTEEYITYVKNLVWRTVGERIQIDELPILSPVLLQESERLMNSYKLDYIDCAQIVTILHGKYSVLSDESESILVTADEPLAKVARKEGARVWYCIKEPIP